MRLPRFCITIAFKSFNWRLETWHEAGPDYFVGHVWIGPFLLMLYTGEAA